MKLRELKRCCVAALLFASSPLMAEDLTLDAAVGGAVGGAIGGAVGAELGGREGAIVGAGVGAAAGTAINTRDHAEPDRGPRYDDSHRVYVYPASHSHPHGNTFCPPGQAKKGRC